MNHNILRRPILTEKSTKGIESRNAYVFEVDGGTNKIEVKKAIEEAFAVKVVKVNIRNRKGKFKRARAVGWLRPGPQGSHCDAQGRRQAGRLLIRSAVLFS
jgi:large subunit ribosomal protein L23